jgi:Ca-activated chloride channel family protein
MKTLLLFISLFSFQAFAQNATIAGKVIDKDTKEPLIGANVVLDGTSWGAATDIYGFFKIKNIPAGTYTIRASYVGYSTETIKDIALSKNDSLFFTIEMKVSSVSTEEIVVQDQKFLEQKATNTKKVIDSDKLNRLPTNETSFFLQNGRNSEVSYLIEGNANDLRYPSDAFNTEEYGLIVENDFLDAYSNPLSTFSIDVDAASYSNARRFIMSGNLPPKDAVRIEEFVNYFDFDYPKPEKDKPFSIFTEMGECPWNKNNYLVHIGIKGKELNDEERRPGNFVFLIDVSGSMTPENKLPLLKKAYKLMVKKLHPQDRVAIVVYAGAAGVILPSTEANEKETIINAIEKLRAGGSTAGGQGIQLAYKIAKENFIKNGNNRIILATDGDFNVGVSSTSEMVRLIEEKRKEGIFLTVLGFGMGNYKDNRLEQIADKGNGNYFYIDNILEAKKVLGHEIMSTLFTIAKDVKLQLEFNPAKVKSYRLIGYENRLLKKEDFDDDTKDAGELGAGHTVTALYEIVPVKDVSALKNNETLKYQDNNLTRQALDSEEVLTLNLRYKEPDEETSRLISRVLKENNNEFEKSTGNLKFSAAVVQFAMLLRDSKYKGESDYDNILKLAEDSKGEDKFGYREEFITLVRMAKRLSDHTDMPE